MIPSLTQPVSQICTYSQFLEPVYDHWIGMTNKRKIIHRKQWEFAYILQSIFTSGNMFYGAKGIGFGVGNEPLPAIFIRQGCRIVATDLSSGKKDWGNSCCAGLEDIPWEGIVDEKTFLTSIIYEDVDMREIPKTYTESEFDFAWSACSLDHLGSLNRGIQFIWDSLECVKPGGVVVHTTELNISDPYNTIREGPTVAFRFKDILDICSMLKRSGHEITLNLGIGYTDQDLSIVMPPYKIKEPHIRIWYEGYVLTSIGLTIVKRG